MQVQRVFLSYFHLRVQDFFLSVMRFSPTLHCERVYLYRYNPYSVYSMRLIYLFIHIYFRIYEPSYRLDYVSVFISRKFTYQIMW